MTIVRTTADRRYRRTGPLQERSPVRSDLLNSGFLWTVVTERARSAIGNRIILIGENGERLSAVDAILRAEAIASSLFTAGLQPGMRVAWQLPNTIETAVIMLALMRLGVVQIPLGMDVRGQAVGAAVASARPDVVLISETPVADDHGDVWAETCGPEHVMTIKPEMWSSGDRRLLPPYDPDDRKPRWLFVQPMPNGANAVVQHTDRTLAIAVHGLVCSGRFDGVRDGVGAGMVPISEAAGLIQLAAMISSAMPALVMQAHEPAHVVGVLRQFQVRMLFGGERTCTELLDRRRALPRGSELVPHLRWFVTYGDPSAPEVGRALERELGIVVTHDYGRCEVPLISVGGIGVRTRKDRIACIGALIPGLSVRITRSGARTPAGVLGDIEVSGAGVFAGYIDPNHNQASFTDDGWFRTGDRGRLTRDEKLRLCSE